MKICPRCKITKLNNVEVKNALSRRDNKTYICFPCGIDEAMFDFGRSKGDVSYEDIDREKEWLKG